MGDDLVGRSHFLTYIFFGGIIPPGGEYLHGVFSGRNFVPRFVCDGDLQVFDARFFSVDGIKMRPVIRAVSVKYDPVKFTACSLHNGMTCKPYRCKADRKHDCQHYCSFQCPHR